MDFYKPEFKKGDLAIYETINKQFLEKFLNPIKGNPRSALETCDLHLEQKQPLMFVDPKGNPTKEIYWNEPRDLQLYWENKLNVIWLFVGLASLIFVFIIYYSGLLPFV